MFVLLVMHTDKFKGSLGFSDKQQLPVCAPGMIHTMFLYKDLKDGSFVRSSL